MERDETEAVLRGKVDLILDSISSLDDKTKIADPQLRKIVDSLREVGNIYYDPYCVMVKPGPDDKINPTPKRKIKPNRMA